MARTKRKINPIRPEAAAPASAGKTYRTAGYVRLSLEDGEAGRGHVGKSKAAHYYLH
jgi:hypothetical protein